MLNLPDIQTISVGVLHLILSFKRARFHILMLEIHSSKLFLADMYIYRVSVTH